MSRAVFRLPLGGSTTLLADDSIENKVINVPSKDGVLPVPADDGLAAQVLTSQGPGASPAWTYLAGTGTVTSVDGSGGTTGLTLAGGPITVAGTLTLDGVLNPTHGGTGAVEPIGYLFGNGPNPASGQLTIPSTDITGLGTMAAQDASNVSISGGTITGITSFASNNVAITGGSISGITDLAIADGGTGASDAATARTNLGLGSISTQGSDSVSITGGTINGVTIGGSSPAAATVTALNATSGVISANSSGDALRITQTGTGNALVVEDSANPDSTPFVIDTSGNIVSGFTTPLLIGVSSPALQLQGTNPSKASLSLNSWQSGTDTAANLYFARGDNNAINDYTVIGSADTLGNVRFYGADGTGMIEAAKISAAVDGTPGTNDMPGRLVFSTTADGASTPTERMRITNAGNVGVGTTTPAAKLSVVGTGYSPNIDLTDAATVAWNTATGQTATFTFVSTNRTMGAPTNLVNGGFYALAVIQNAGSNTLTWNAVFKWAGGVAPTLSTAASAKDYFVFRSDGTNLYEQGRSLGAA